MDVKGVKLDEIKKIVVEYCTNLGQDAQEEKGEVISYLRAMLTRLNLCCFMALVVTIMSARFEVPIRVDTLIISYNIQIN